MRTVLMESLVVFAMVTGALAQESPQKDIPPRPWPARAPRFSAWTEVVKIEPVPESKDQGASPSSPAKLPQPFVLCTVKVAKTGPVVSREIAYFSGVNSGQKWQQWHKDGVEVTITPDLREPMVLKNAGASTFYHPYEHADFEGFEWLSEQNFVGVTNYQGRPCYAFKGRMVFTPSGPVPVASDAELEKQKQEFPDATVFDVVALLDKQSMMPLLLRLPGETHTYSYAQPPSGMLDIPPALLRYWAKPTPRPVVPAP